MKILTMILIGFVVWYVLQVIADWKIFSKAGKSGILAFIPIVNVFTEYSICWSSVMGVVYLICVGIASYVNGVQEPSSTLAAVAGVAGLVGTVLHIMQSIKLAKSFGKGSATASSSLSLDLWPASFSASATASISVSTEPNSAE